MFGVFGVVAGRERRRWRRGMSSIASLVLVLGGCAGGHRPPETSGPDARVTDPSSPPIDGHEPEAPEGLFHVVEPGQTLWRIARAYGVPVETVAEANGIEDPSRLVAGASLWIPGASRPLRIPPYPAPPPFPEDATQGTAPFPESPGEFLWPVEGGVLLSRFGAARRTHRHSGIDIRGARGQEIRAAREGRVVRAGQSGSGYGRMVVLDHGDGVRTLYAHALAVLVRVGDVVRRGQAIALVGRSGNATAEHCHFEIRRDDVAVDPMPYLTGVVEARR